MTERKLTTITEALARQDRISRYLRAEKQENDPVAGLRKLGIKLGKVEQHKWKPENRNLI